MGAVPKSTDPFWRLVTDARPVNVFADKWNVKYISIRSLRLILGPKMLFWTVDLKSAYHLCVLGGCGRPWKKILRWLSSEDGKTYELLRSRIYGCDGSDCSLGCDKSMLAVCPAFSEGSGQRSAFVGGVRPCVRVQLLSYVFRLSVAGGT